VSAQLCNAGLARWKNYERIRLGEWVMDSGAWTGYARLDFTIQGPGDVWGLRWKYHCAGKRLRQQGSLPESGVGFPAAPDLIRGPYTSTVTGRLCRVRLEPTYDPDHCAGSDTTST
jgi:hypothetical protein